MPTFWVQCGPNADPNIRKVRNADLFGSTVVYNLTYFLDPKMKCLVTQKFDLDPINIDLRNGKMSKILNLEWWSSQFLGLKILTLIPLNQYIFSVFLQVWCSPVSKWWLKWT